MCDATTNEWVIWLWLNLATKNKQKLKIEKTKNEKRIYDDDNKFDKKHKTKDMKIMWMY